MCRRTRDRRHPAVTGGVCVLRPSERRYRSVDTAADRTAVRVALMGLTVAALGWHGSRAVSILIEVPVGTVSGLILSNLESLVSLWRPVDGSSSGVRGGSPAEAGR